MNHLQRTALALTALLLSTATSLQARTGLRNQKLRIVRQPVELTTAQATEGTSLAADILASSSSNPNQPIDQAVVVARAAERLSQVSDPAVRGEAAKNILNTVTEPEITAQLISRAEDNLTQGIDITKMAQQDDDAASTSASNPDEDENYVESDDSDDQAPATGQRWTKTQKALAVGGLITLALFAAYLTTGIAYMDPAGTPSAGVNATGNATFWERLLTSFDRTNKHLGNLTSEYVSTPFTKYVGTPVATAVGSAYNATRDSLQSGMETVGSYFTAGNATAGTGSGGNQTNANSTQDAGNGTSGAAPAAGNHSANATSGVGNNSTTASQ